MNHFFIICEYEYDNQEVDYFILTDWKKETEEGFWRETFDRWRGSIENLVDYYIERCVGQNRSYPPYFFYSLKEAKEAADILKAHDDPEEQKKQQVRFPRYYIIKSTVKSIPIEFVEYLEV